MFSLEFDLNTLQTIPLFNNIINSLHDGVLIADQDGIVKYVNSAYLRLTGVSSRDVLHKQIEEVRPGARLPEVLKTGKPLLGIRRKVRSIEYIADISPILLGGKVVGAISIVRDITEITELSGKLKDFTHKVQELSNRVRQIHRAQYDFSDIIGSSPEIRKAKTLAQRAAAGDSPVLILGESGSGKELFAHAIHKAGPRCNAPFVAVNCAAFSPQLLASELFGYEQGSFTGALRGGKMGLFEIASGGCLFLDEIGDMEYDLQSKLLRVLETGEFMRIGGTKPVQVDVRILSATNREISSLIRESKFREDLSYRLNVIPLTIPPLRTRIEDIPLLVDFFLERLSRRRGKRYAVSPPAINILNQYDYPGNVRELFNILEFAANMSDTGEIMPKDLPILSKVRPQISVRRALTAAARASEKDMISRALKNYGNSVDGKRKAAGYLGISLATLYNKIRQYDL
ncbi:MAG: Formate hydrogenlyase transcriptional activator [Syntrophaceae bacterium PtaB.Bin038]|nr:MAG: Formate hydrogenlyase transcriptional activator [Syntrophaceae bacterium PtaB.Bin038]